MIRAHYRRLFLATCLLASPAFAATDTAPTVSPLPARKPVVVSGTVPDEATRQAILDRTRELYGRDNVVDQLGVGQVSTPVNWSDYVQKLLSADLKQISGGQFAVDGNNVSLRGNVGSEATRQQLVSDMATRLNPSWQVKNGLRVAAGDQQLLDQALANRIIEFDTGSTRIAPAGTAILDEMASALLKMGGRNIDIIGHTDNQGSATSNQALSEGRAAAVRQYLIQKGIEANSMRATGVGAQSPVALNTTAEGRARNRRIEFRAR
ncbi:OmpA family protein [Niveibacterium sp. SC-1]|uniref:OmpA family protein n=1 Tax=Niveibacterium sp. SC-1 TaxID=3135646 RepID=UPI00311F9CF5